MKSAEEPRQHLTLWRPREESEFLPAALEIVETPASPAGRAVGVAIIAFFLVALVWACFGKVDVIATAQGRVVPAGEVKLIQPLETAAVRAIHVEDGAQVHAGDVLIELDPTIAGADRERLSRDLIHARLDAAEFGALKQQMDLRKRGPAFIMPAGIDATDAEVAKAATQARAQEQASKLASFDQQIGQKIAELAEINATVERLDETIPILREKERIRRELKEVQFGNQIAYLDAQQQLLDAVHEHDVQSHRLTEITSAKKSLEQQRDEARANYAVDILTKLAEAEQKTSGLTQELLKAEQKKSETELRTPIDGTVQQLALHTVGGVVTPAQPVMVIVPNGGNLLVEAIVSNSDVGFVHAGQDVEVKVETFTFTRYGLLRGHVLSISADTVTRPDARRDAESNDGSGARADRPASGSPAYIARIKLDQTRMMIDGQEQSLGPGMAVTAEIKTGRRTIMDYLLSPLVARTAESLHER